MIKYKLTTMSVLACYFYQRVMMGEAVGTEKAVEIIDIYTHKVVERDLID